MKISFICPSRNNLKYLKWSYDSVQKNKGNHEVEFCVADDFSSDGTAEWCSEIAAKDSNFKWFRNDGPERLGHTILYDDIVKNLATSEICIIWHADMYLCPGALDAVENQLWRPTIYRENKGFPKGGMHRYKTICSLTRIEPPLHPDGPEKVLWDLGTEPETFKEKDLLYHFEDNLWLSPIDDKKALNKQIKEEYFKQTEGVFAPWAFFKKDFLEIGGHDPLFAPQSKEDSDIWNRMKLAGFKFIQTWEGFVYHMTCRGSRFNPTITKVGTNSDEWQKQNLISTRNFIRKWGHFVAHDEYLNPIVYPKFNVAVVITGTIPDNAQLGVMAAMEPFCSALFADISRQARESYITNEQPNTPYNLDSRVVNTEPLSESFEEFVTKYDVVLLAEVNQIKTEEIQFLHQISGIVEQYINDQNDGNYNIEGKFSLGSWMVYLNLKQKPDTEVLIHDICDPNWKTMPIYRK